MAGTWEEIDGQTQEHLQEWYNQRSLDDKDRTLLANLFHAGNFRAWDCPGCDTKCMVGQPDDWGHFQGVNQSETLGELCNYCAGQYLILKEYAE